MFSLNIIISHYKLLKKSKSIDEEEIISSLKNIIKLRGGIISDYSNYLSYYPSNYQYSKETFIVCIQEIYVLLSNVLELSGFSLIIDNKSPKSEFDFTENYNQLILKTTDVDKIWFTPDAYKQISNLIPCSDSGFLFMASDSLLELKFCEDQNKKHLIYNSVQSLFDSIESTVTTFNSKINIDLHYNIEYWAKSKNIDKVLFLDFDNNPDKILKFVYYIINLKDLFNPLNELSEDELISWGIYIELYQSLLDNSYDSFALDDSEMHFCNLINLWIGSFSKRYQTLFIFKYIKDSRGLESIVTVISNHKNVKLFLFNQNIENYNNKQKLPKLFKLEDYIGESIENYINKKSDDSNMILYISLLVNGTISTTDLIQILNISISNILIIKEELENYKRLGFLLGDSYLYSGDDNLIPTIERVMNEKIKFWKNNFLESFIKSKLNNRFCYSYIFSILSFDSKYNKESLTVLYHYIQRILDLGRFIKLSPVFEENIDNNQHLKNILLYKRIRESRLRDELSQARITNYIDHDTGEIPIEYLELQNLWTNCGDKELIKRCKDLYYKYQTNGEQFNESRIKTLFALSLLSVGSVNESVDYFDLNCGFSKSISDTLGYIRNVSFYCTALFVKGDISGVIRVSDRLLSYNWINFKTKWLLYIKFIRIRAFIELGRYSDSLEAIEQGLELAKNHGYTDIKTVYLNWKGKVQFYLGMVDDARNTILTNDLTNEGYFFLSEIEFYSGNIDQAVYYTDLIDLSNDDILLFDENIKWRDGFFLIEEFFNRGNRKSVLFQEIINFRYMIKIINRDENALDEYYKIICEISKNKICVHEYRYIYYLYKATEKLEPSGSFNRDNLLNKVTRLLHQRASNITAHNLKHFYLENFYNKPIIEISRTKKLF